MRESLTLLLAPHLEALELPITVERANLQKPHANMILAQHNAHALH